MGAVQPPIVVHEVGRWCVVEFKTASLMDTMELARIADVIYPLVEAQDKRHIVLDFASVQYLSSQAVGILLTLNGKLKAHPPSKLVLCGVSPKLTELLKITRLDRVLTIKPTRAEAVKISTD